MTDLELLELNDALSNLRKDTVKRIRALLVNNTEPGVYVFKNCELYNWQVEEFKDAYEEEKIKLYQDHWSEKIVLDFTQCKNIDAALSAQTELFGMLKPVTKRRASALGI